MDPGSQAHLGAEPRRAEGAACALIWAPTSSSTASTKPGILHPRPAVLNLEELPSGGPYVLEDKLRPFKAPVRLPADGIPGYQRRSFWREEDRADGAMAGKFEYFYEEVKRIPNICGSWTILKTSTAARSIWIRPFLDFRRPPRRKLLMSGGVFAELTTGNILVLMTRNRQSAAGFSVAASCL